MSLEKKLLDPHTQFQTVYDLVCQSQGAFFHMEVQNPVMPFPTTSLMYSPQDGTPIMVGLISFVMGQPHFDSKEQSKYFSLIKDKCKRFPGLGRMVSIKDCLK